VKKLKEISKEQFLELASVGATVIYDHSSHSGAYNYSYDSHDTLLSTAESNRFGKESDFRTAKEFLSTLWNGREGAIEFKFFALVDADSSASCDSECDERAE